nr:hypothetical protein [Neisseria chenwenguii]
MLLVNAVLLGKQQRFAVGLDKNAQKRVNHQFDAAYLAHFAVIKSLAAKCGKQRFELFNGTFVARRQHQ